MNPIAINRKLDEARQAVEMAAGIVSDSQRQVAEVKGLVAGLKADFAEVKELLQSLSPPESTASTRPARKDR